MGFFDNIIAEEETSTQVLSQTKKDLAKESTGNNSDLIIIDNMTFSEDIERNDIISENNISDEVTFINDSTTDNSSDIEIEEEPEISINLDMTSIIGGDDSKTGDDSKKGDPNAILDEAIKKLITLLASHVNLREQKMEEVEDINAKINLLKEEAKKLTNESKLISDEESKINKMIELFNTQKIS